ncbi:MULTISPECIES: G1 family glutamic endopeptidase [Paenibacillus]|uniref:G1 family glutamic endopeptidase n=1 Tax=Paenibacillus TaxID=44249 RepID=UPI00096F49A7|nr:G1 family glutamic endopeptidase [Paenibacillus odorifer]OMD59640.1 hypothetical protein BSK55_09520 [Paenibacillus odorifer]OME53820.1 hypothetical protein BSK61_16455 [Paenibacillus odorifer]
MNDKQNSNRVNHPCLKDKSNANKFQSSGFGWSSTNWSGYTITGKKGAFNRIAGEWIVPYVKPTSKPSYSSAWIGIDGFKNSSLIQTGTGHEFVNGRARYYAWWEILPDVETVIPLPVSPGDHIKANITKVGRNKWTITLRNLSRNWIFRTLQRYTGPQTSGEWIMEAPEVDGSIAKLARVSPTCFYCCRINGKSPRLTLNMGGIMVQNNATIAVPSCPNHRGDSFTVKRTYPK